MNVREEVEEEKGLRREASVVWMDEESCEGRRGSEEREMGKGTCSSQSSATVGTAAESRKTK